MNSNKAEKLNQIDELLESTSAEKRIKFKLPDNISDELSEEKSDTNTPEYSKIDTDDGQLHIIDETITVYAYNDNEPTVSEVEEENYDEPAPKAPQAPKPKKVKKPKVQKPQKNKKVKFNVWQWILLVVCSLITLWFVIFTVDYTLASTGNSPLFCVETQSFEDGSRSYAGAGYKVQFFFEPDGTLYKNVMPFWKEGPNDELVKDTGNPSDTTEPQDSDNGVSFE